MTSFPTTREPSEHGKQQGNKKRRTDTTRYDTTRHDTIRCVSDTIEKEKRPLIIVGKPISYFCKVVLYSTSDGVLATRRDASLAASKQQNTHLQAPKFNLAIYSARYLAATHLPEGILVSIPSHPHLRLGGPLALQLRHRLPPRKIDNKRKRDERRETRL